MKEMTDEERRTAVKMLRDKAEEILNDPVNEKREKLKGDSEPRVVAQGSPFVNDKRENLKDRIMLILFLCYGSKKCDEVAERILKEIEK